MLCFIYVYIHFKIECHVAQAGHIVEDNFELLMLLSLPVSLEMPGMRHTPTLCSAEDSNQGFTHSR